MSLQVIGTYLQQNIIVTIPKKIMKSLECFNHLVHKKTQ